MIINTLLWLLVSRIMFEGFSETICLLVILSDVHLASSQTLCLDLSLQLLYLFMFSMGVPCELCNTEHQFIDILSLSVYDIFLSTYFISNFYFANVT